MTYKTKDKTFIIMSTLLFLQSADIKNLSMENTGENFSPSKWMSFALR